MFDFIQTLFLFSLGITFVLIMLLMYHFKNRMVTLEQKHDVLLEILNSLVQETHVLKSIVGALWRPQPQPVIDEEELDEVEELEDEEVEEEEDLEEDEEVEEEEVVEEEVMEEEVVEEEVMEEEVVEEEVVEEEVVEEEEPVTLEKLKLSELRAAVVERGLTTDASKMKRPQLLALLGQK